MDVSKMDLMTQRTTKHMSWMKVNRWTRFRGT